jgi:alcohol dehydrogenase
MKIRAAVLHTMSLPLPYAQSQPLKIEHVDLAPPGPGEVLVKIRAAGLCHSDLSTINGDRPRQLPMVLGHEASGEVVELGAGVTDLKIGDHVVMIFAPTCGHCMPCVEGRPTHCEPGQTANGAGLLMGGISRLSQNGAKVHHHMGVAAFAEYTVANRGSMVKIDSSLPFDEAALFGCAVLTGVGAVINTAKVTAGNSVAVVGLGGVGLNSILGAVLAGAREIIALDIHDDKLHIAKQLGATATVNAKDSDAIQQVKDLTKGGVDFAFEMAGSVHAMELAYRITRRGGTTVTAGLPNPDARWQMQHVNLTAEERTIKGSYMGSSIAARDVPRYVSLYQQGKLPVNKLMSERLKLEDINAGFDRLTSGHTVRQIIVF